MKSAIDEIITELKAKGYRITQARENVIGVLCTQTQPVTIQALSSKVKGVDEASVYRTVKVLLDEDLIEEIVLQGELSRYAVSDEHHHHAICTACGIMEHIECEARAFSVPSQFKTVESHEVTLYGLCKKCA